MGDEIAIIVGVIRRPDAAVSKACGTSLTFGHPKGTLYPGREHRGAVSNPSRIPRGTQSKTRDINYVGANASRFDVAVALLIRTDLSPSGTESSNPPRPPVPRLGHSFSGSQHRRNAAECGYSRQAVRTTDALQDVQFRPLSVLPAPLLWHNRTTAVLVWMLEASKFNGLESS
jgi:hypothetical protein